MAKSKKPNILVIWGDDIGQSNLSCYIHGLVGYQTPNIDRIAREGMIFTDSNGEQSCAAGRSSFITGANSDHSLRRGDPSTSLRSVRDDGSRNAVTSSQNRPKVDIPMLRFAGAETPPALRLVVLHDDAECEFDDQKGAEDAIARASEKDWTMISNKDGWSRVFAD